jgi:hypothetical protein
LSRRGRYQFQSPSSFIVAGRRMARMLVYVLAGQASKSALLSLSVGMKAIVSAVNAVIGFAALFLMLRTLRWRTALEPDSVEPQDAGP